ncbi:hypothetical protein I090019C5_35240 [Phocaeicola massiliensis]|jgi:hypothetical protein|uniref:hypothetical protein n=1 Tax=Phocaeicola massiliensis TaxID=204516 RepID=UPI0034BC716B
MKKRKFEMKKEICRGIWYSVRVLLQFDNKYDAKKLIHFAGLTKSNCLELESDFGLVCQKTLDFIDYAFEEDGVDNCSKCKHYYIQHDNCTMQCHWLGKRITPRKKPCKHYEVRENSDGKAIQ